MRSLFDPDGPIVDFLYKFGNLIMLNIIWILCCLPVVTIGASTISLYYSIAKTLRYGEGYPAREFFRCFGRVLKKSLPVWLVLLVLALVVSGNVNSLKDAEIGTMDGFLYRANQFVEVVLVLMAMVIFPVMSRFDIGFKKIFSFSLKLSIKNLFRTLGIFAMVAASVYVIGFVNYFTVLIIPSILCFLTTFLLEPVFARYVSDDELKLEQAPWYVEAAKEEKERREKNEKRKG